MVVGFFFFFFGGRSFASFHPQLIFLLFPF